MHLTISEQATLYFYQWEYRNRGYYHFDTPVDIEPPYIPFQHQRYQAPLIDDGRAPSLFSRVTKLLLPPQENKKQEIVEVDRTPKYLEHRESTLVGYRMSFSFGEDISPLRNVEFLSMLSFTAEPVSFEIVGNSETITIQIVCDEYDSEQIHSLCRAYFPTIQLSEIDIGSFGFDRERDIAIADFGLSDEFMRPIQTTSSFSLDPLTAIIGNLETITAHDVAVIQILFKGITSPLAKDITTSVSDGAGGSFFEDAPEMPQCAKEKISNPLFSVVFRIATQGNTAERSSYLVRQLAQSVASISQSEYNKLIPLSNEGYSYDFHEYNLHNRLSNRLGFILNSNELNTFVHYPNNTITSIKLGTQGGKTKLLPEIAKDKKYVIGINQHEGQEYSAGIDDDTFSRHMVIGGATGTGKTHLVKQLVYQDLQYNNATFVIDPHGDLVNDILETITVHESNNVVYINMADDKYSFGFNIFGAESEAEKTVLASDLASAFSDSWISSGDRINSVLQKTISTFVYCEKEASILDMKRFLLEQNFRQEFLDTLDDPILQYYWQNEFPLVKRNELSPLLLRIDSFMQTRLLRNIFCQTKGVNFNELVEEQKLVLIQLSVGLIGFENSKFLARLIITKINQVAFARQNQSKGNRKPIHLYIDESQNYANSPVIENILSGARKYNLSLILVLQHLEQVQHDLLNSMLTNTATQIFFRQGDKDSKRIAGSYSFFDAEDFMELGRGEALVRMIKRSNDFNVQTLPLKRKPQEQTFAGYITLASRTRYAQTKEKLSELLATLLPNAKVDQKKTPVEPKEVEVNIPEKHVEKPIIGEVEPIITKDATSLEEKKQAFLQELTHKEQTQKHITLQKYVQTIGRQRGYKVTLEKDVSGGRIDVCLERENLAIAIEISITNSIEYEVKNIQKCINAHYQHIYMVCESKTHLRNIKKRAAEILKKEDLKKVQYMLQDGIIKALNALEPKEKKEVKKVRGYRVTSNQIDINDSDAQEKGTTLHNLISKLCKKPKKK